MRVFNTEPVRESQTWTRETIPLPITPEGSGPRRLVRALGNVKTALRAATADDVVVFTDDNPLSANLFGLCKRLRPSGPTLIRTDPLFHMPRNFWRKRFLQAAVKAVDCIIVWAPAVVERYHRYLGIPKEKMVPWRFHHTLQTFADSTRCGDYVFSGGNSMRDYPTLIEAVRGLTIPVRIATHWQPPAHLNIPANVTLGPTSAAEFLSLLAGARFVVFPLLMDDVRTSGQQSYLNAMALGKAVIVADDADAPFYIDDGKTGVVVPSGDAPALRRAICCLIDDPEAIRSLGEQARAAATPIDQEHTWSGVLAIAREVHRHRNKE
jgi:glycosyltransferase involved in cell wall biosynthesis